MKTSMIIATLLLFCVNANSADLLIKRESAYLRKGPASYYEILSIIPVNSKVKGIKKLDGWHQVEFQKMKGYISAGALLDKQLNSVAFTNVQSSKVASVSQHSISAGVKGFAQKYDRQMGLSGDSLFWDMALSRQIDTTRFNNFNKQTYIGVKQSSFRTEFPLQTKATPDYFSIAHDGFGLSVAAVISRIGLFDSPELLDYINFVGQTIVNASDAGDVTFRFFILDLSIPNAYACPGGYVFISRGMLQMAVDEAELAFVLAHEIAHVTRFHGMIEMKARENQIGADDLFAELNADIPEAYDSKAQEIEKELEEDIFQIFESLIQGRLDAYEKEADAVALRYLARAGYNPSAASNILARLHATRYESNNQHYRKESIAQRIMWLKSEMQAYRSPKNKFFDHSRRWQDMQYLINR